MHTCIIENVTGALKGVIIWGILGASECDILLVDVSDQMAKNVAYLQTL